MMKYLLKHVPPPEPDAPICDISSWVRGVGRQSMGEHFERKSSGELLGNSGRVAWKSGSGRFLWAGYPGRTRVVDARRVSVLVGNIFEPEKMAAVCQAILDPPEVGALLFVAPLAHVGLVDLSDVRDSLDSHKRGVLFEEMGLTRPFTTGDIELDAYLQRPDDVLDEETYEDEPGSRDEVKEGYEARIEEALRARAGDLGHPWVRLRDGHHRVFGAIAAGEPWVCALVEEDPAMILSIPDRVRV